MTEEPDARDSLEPMPDDLSEVSADLRAVFLVDPDELVARRHLSAMAAAGGALSAPVTHRRRRVLVPAGVVGGLILATSGLAAAGVLPAPMQRAVAAVARPFGVELQTDQAPVRSDTPDAGPPGSAPPITASDDPSRDAPGHGGTNPGRSDDAPGQQDAPGASGDAPGHGGDNPGKSDQAPGHDPTSTSPGKSGDAPGHNPTSTSPGKSGGAPGHNPTSTSPGNSGNGNPGNGNSGNAPGHNPTSTNPGNGKSGK